MALVAAMLAGCAMQPKSGTAPTGQPLLLQTEVRQQQVRSNEKVGTVQHRDSNGNSLGSSDVYQERVDTVSTFHWRPMQGGDYISDEDLYRIAGNEEAAERAKKYRRIGHAMLWSGVAGAVVGLGVMSAGSWLWSGGQSKLGAGLSISGLLLLGGGGTAGYFGLRRLTVDGHPYPFEYAEQEVLEYNRRLESPPMVPEGKSVSFRLISGAF